MAGSFTLPTVLANLTAGNQPLSLIDGDLTALATPLLTLSTFGNYYADAGAANAYVITVPSPQVVALAAGLPIQFLASATNTGASTLAINALGAKNILNADGSALGASQIVSGGIYSIMYDGTQFRLLGLGMFASSYTGTLTGCTTAPTATINYTVIGNVVTLYSPTLTATSNTTACTITGGPVPMRPATQKNFVAITQDNGAAGVASLCAILTSGVISLTANANNGAFTAGGAKGLLWGHALSYPLT